MSGELVKLNVGGTKFMTTLSTINKGDHMLQRLFSGSFDNKTDDEGYVFIDRDGKHFNIILNFLRDGHVSLPLCLRELQEIKTEAEFYSIMHLVECCEIKMKELKGSGLTLKYHGGDKKVVIKGKQMYVSTCQHGTFYGFGGRYQHREHTFCVMNDNSISLENVKGPMPYAAGVVEIEDDDQNKSLVLPMVDGHIYPSNLGWHTKELGRNKYTYYAVSNLARSNNNPFCLSEEMSTECKQCK